MASKQNRAFFVVYREWKTKTWSYSGKVFWVRSKADNYANDIRKRSTFGDRARVVPVLLPKVPDGGRA